MNKEKIKVGDKFYKIEFGMINWRKGYKIGIKEVVVCKVNKTTFKVKGESTLYNLTGLCNLNGLYPRGGGTPLYSSVPSYILDEVAENKLLLEASALVSRANDDIQAIDHNINTSYGKKEIIDELKIINNSLAKIKELINE